MEDNTARELIIRQSWETMENQLLLSGNTLVQRASVELVCNLMLSPTGVTKFADGGAKAKTRMHILLALADVEDVATRRAALLEQQKPIQQLEEEGTLAVAKETRATSERHLNVDTSKGEDASGIVPLGCIQLHPIADEVHRRCQCPGLQRHRGSIGRTRAYLCFY